MKKVCLLLCCFIFLFAVACEKAEESPQIYAETDHEYLSEIAGKCYMAEGGQLLTFYKDGVATYDFQNGVKVNHHYNYRVIIVDSTEDALNMAFVRLSDVSENYETQDYIDNGAEIVKFNKANDSITYYKLNYKCIFDDQSGFKNEYGTFSTVCEEEGCERFIAPTGNTRFCTEHSHACAKCRKFINPNGTYCEKCATATSSDDEKGCAACNGTGYVKYYYGDSDLEAFLDGYDPYTVKKCTSCNN